ncbi:prepilin peptidase [Aliihoeflea sp. 40Bstr573]|uniref:A24 family peptidase n=1 Tax=Aliihoeflea sp. 40Bstr573 TaxID=2696467 RepID=UPI0020951425|nr:prepilin peptidase [Aliihoeflea sp. 40Bstr573]MCO6387588.1 peptidase [Aliihoeflea sp. 40Bstr573]
MVEALILVIFPFCMVYAAVSDMITMTIANRVSVLLVATFLVVAPLTGMPVAMLGMHVMAAAAVLCVTFALFALGTMGGGDAKLLAATALWMGFGMPLAEYVVVGAVWGGMLTLLILAYRNSPISDVTGNFVLLRNFADRRVGIPYGIALGAAGLMVFPSSPMGAWAIQSLVR